MSDTPSQITLSFPDGNARDYDAGITGLEVAASISKSLSKKALAFSIDGEVRDLQDSVPGSGEIKLIMREDDEALELIRHDAAHVMAEAVQQLWPGTQVTIGPTIENGFYYDFDREETFKPEELQKIENKMRQIIKRNEKFVKEIWSRADAIKHFTAEGELFKVELIEAIPEGDDIRIFIARANGSIFVVDRICRRWVKSVQRLN